MTTEWQPMSSAPKDGTYVLCAHRHWAHADCLYFDAHTGDWVDGHGLTSSDPSHWQPLPSPPAAGE